MQKTRDVDDSKNNESKIDLILPKAKLLQCEYRQLKSIHIKARVRQGVNECKYIQIEYLSSDACVPATTEKIH